MGLREQGKRAWKLWGDWNNLKELIDLFGWKEWLRDQFVSLFFSFIGGGVIGVFVGAISIGSPIGVLVWALVVGVLAAAFAAFISLSRALSRISLSMAAGTNNPSITAELNSISGVLDGLSVVCSLTVENCTGEFLEERCLVRLLEMSARWPATMPRYFVLRTEGQISGRRSGRFNLAVGEKKMIPVLFQEGEDFVILIDENYANRPADERQQSRHHIPFPPRTELKMIIETNGAAIPGRYLLTSYRGEDDWRLTSKLELVSPNYMLH